MIIAVDLDGVISDIHTIALQLFNMEHGIGAKLSDINQWSAVIGGHEFAPFIYKSIQDEALHATLPVMEGAREGMVRLHKKHEVVIVTSRPNTPTPWILEWLKVHDIPYHWLLNTGHAHKGLVRADAMIDDYPGNLEKFIGYQTLFDRPWNQDCELYNRIRSWDSLGKE